MNNFSNFVPVSGVIIPLEFPTFKKWLIAVHDHVVPHERNNYHPHALSHRVLALLSILVVTVKIVGVSMVAIGPAATSLAAPITTENIVNLTNIARAEHGMAELKTSSLLAKAAQNKADDMLARQYFAHNTPDGQTPWSFIKAVGYSYTTAGENLAIDFTQAENIQAAWMNSPGHRANILNKNFTEIGIGIAKGIYDNHQTTIVVQMFGNPLVAPVVLQDNPTPVQAPAQQPAPTSQPAPVAANPIPVNQVPESIVVAENNAEISIQPEVDLRSGPIQIFDTKTVLQGDQLYLEVTASDNAVKLIAFYGKRSLMLDPLGDGIWKGMIPMSVLGNYDNLSVQAHDINGQMHQQPIAQFGNKFGALPAGEVEGAEVSILGNNINLKVWEEKIFLVLLAALIAALILAIAIKRHVQHVSLIANTSFVAMLIVMMLVL
ncbi:MAG TPA: CAP domain-containing protein [Candidatus Doudnabacteria bacterium]|nr:CAP domain-containing protein [Candidatus Doudnabacteria bacterium]